MKFFQILSVLFTFTSCQKVADESKLNYAMVNDESVLTSIVGLMELNRSHVKRNFENISVCVGYVEDSKDSITSEELLLETKLAYVMWMEATNRYGVKDWGKFVFEQSDSCGRDSGHAAYVKMSGYNLGQVSSPGAMLFTAGEGNSSELITVETTEDNKSWLSEARLVHPAYSILNSVLYWASLKKILQSKKANSLVEEYEGMLDGDRQSYQNLVKFSKLLHASKIYTSSNLVEGDKQYVSSFSTILHEVGHQFGLGHADGSNSSSPDEINGKNISDIKKKRNKNYKTKKSIMAYADQYVYLPQDDQNGVKAIRNAVVNLVAKGMKNHPKE